jgi:acyl-homoserine lactone synthase
MSEIIIINSERRQYFTDLMEQAYRLRYKVFVEEKGWLYKQNEERRDFDEIDAGGECVYFLALEGAKVIGHARLVPSTATNPIIRTTEKIKLLQSRPSIMGFSLVCIEPDMRGGPKAKAISGQLLLAACDYALENGLAELFIETDPSFFILLRLLGFSLEVHDRGMDIYGAKTAFGIVSIDEKAVASCRKKMNLLDMKAFRGLKGNDALLGEDPAFQSK